MKSGRTIHLDALILGGGIAGLWTLRELLDRGYRAVLAEPFALGAGQTMWSQGIIHGGLKYTLAELLSPSAEKIREMPAIWRDCLAGRRSPDLSMARVRAERCYLWRTGSLLSRAGMLGARVGLRVAPVSLGPGERPPILADSPGTVARLDEQVIDPGAVLAALAAGCPGAIAHVDPLDGIDFNLGGDGLVRSVTLRPSRGEGEREHAADASITLAPARLILTAGAGNAALRERLGLPGGAMQTRPLRMLMARGPAEGPGSLPDLCGHCVEGARTRVTLTSALDSAGRRVWQVGGEVAEKGATLSHDDLMKFGRRETLAALPALDTRALEWTTYRADRAEAATSAGLRPDDATVRAEGAVLTAWPTKLALAPRLAALIAGSLPPPIGSASADIEELRAWPRPAVAPPPWECAEAVWTADADLA